jgi:predicted nuclease of predicted toxin-antitoxin system
MRLLFDQNISFRICRLLSESFSECRHVSSVGLHNHEDIDIWKFAKTNGFSIVTFDADYFDLSLLKGSPPKIIWLRTGNISTDDLANRILMNTRTIQLFLDNPEQNCLEIY